MTSIKIKFRKASKKGHTGSVYYQIIHKKRVKNMKTGIKILPSEWDEENSRIYWNSASNERAEELKSFYNKITGDITILQAIINEAQETNTTFSVDNISTKFLLFKRQFSLELFVKERVMELQLAGRTRTAETYMSALASVKNFAKQQELTIFNITERFMMEYEGWMRNKGLTRNTSSFYMRILRAIYNKAANMGLIQQKNPFKNVYTGIDKTKKRAITITLMQQLKNMDLSNKPSLELARDLFLFSFYTRGMSFIDMAFLKKSDLANGILTYRRRKTGQQLSIRWEKCMQDIVDKHKSPESRYLLPIIKECDKDNTLQYKNALHLTNYNLKQLATKLNISIPLTMYVARHSWASIAASQQIPISIISQGMGHDSETTTQIYIASIQTNSIDKANKKIINLI